MKRPSKKRVASLEKHRQEIQDELRPIAVPLAEAAKKQIGDEGGVLLIVFRPDKSGHDIFYFEYRGKVINVLGSLEEVRNRLYQIAAARPPEIRATEPPKTK